MSTAQILHSDARLISTDPTLADALIARAPFIFPRLASPDEIRDITLRLLAYAQIRLTRMPVRIEVRELAAQSLRDLGCCVRGEDRDHTTGMTSLRLLETVLNHGGEADLADAISCGVRTLCQRMKVN